MDDDMFLPLMVAAKRFNMSPRKVRELVRAGQLPVFAAPLDKRLKLVRLADVEALSTPTPVGLPLKPPKDPTRGP